MDFALEQKQEGHVEKDMRLIRETISENPELGAMLNSPVIKGSDKKAALDALFKETSKISKQLFGLLADNKRIGLLDLVAERYLGQNPQTMQGHYRQGSDHRKPGRPQPDWRFCPPGWRPGIQCQPGQQAGQPETRTHSEININPGPQKQRVRPLYDRKWQESKPLRYQQF